MQNNKCETMMNSGGHSILDDLCSMHIKVYMPPSLEESLSIPTMVSLTHCLKQLIKRLPRLPISHVVMCPTWLSYLSHLNDSIEDQ